MKVNINNHSERGKLCWVEVTKKEVLSLIKSLVNQLQDGPNSGRLESRCSGDVKELSIAVIDAP